VIFIDTGAFLGRYIARDQYHAVAVGCWEDLRDGGSHCFTSNYVLDETFTLLGRRAGYTFAAARARKILASQNLTILRPVHEDEVHAVEFFEKFADQEVSFTDCVSFVLMRKKRLKRVFCFDEHFRRVGFEVWPS
jgi:predicted nucleic acid-binding protein